MSRRAWGAVVATVIAGCVKFPPPSPPRTTEMGISFSKLELPNGLRVVVVTDPSATEMQVTMRYGVGTVDELPAQTGIAHLVEHLMFHQTVGGRSIFAQLEDIATSFNGATTFDGTTFVARAARSELDALLSIEAARLEKRCASITDSMFVRERAVVVNEIRERALATTIFEAIYAGLYPAGHAYARRVSGQDALMHSLTREQACAFADAHYTPGNAVLVVSGNVTVEEIAPSLSKSFAGIERRDAAPRTPIDLVAEAKRRVSSQAPIDLELVIVAWPLPKDPKLKSQVRAVVSAVTMSVAARTIGMTLPLSFGDARAEMVGFVVIPAPTETSEQVRARAADEIDDLPFSVGERSIWGRLSFTRIKQAALYNLFASLEDGSGRDVRLAAYALAGLDPGTALADEVDTLKAMTADDATRIASDHVRFDQATLVVLVPSGNTPRVPLNTALSAPVHDRGLARAATDPAEARRGITSGPAPGRVDRVTRRRLGNGLAVVLAPLASIPTVDVRLIFEAGTADEPAGKPGVAIATAHGLTADPRHFGDLLLFAAAGSGDSVEVGADHTSFSVRGLDMHLDFMLAALRRWVLDGNIDPEAAATALDRDAARTADRGAVVDAWLAALYGNDHPYVRVFARNGGERLALTDLQAFRAARFKPRNATLVIAGRFDPALADRWIDYLFGDWSGAPRERRDVARAVSTPAAFARADDETAQLAISVALAANAGGRAEQLVAADMLAEIAGDVRHQLGASYGLNVELVEARQARWYQLVGSVDATRASSAIELLRTRIEQLRTDADVAARAFVRARDRVAIDLSSFVGSAGHLGARVERDVELDRSPMSDLETATAVRALTIDRMGETLAEIELARAVVAMRGPRAVVERSFAELGRKPTFVGEERDASAPLRAVVTGSLDIRIDDLEDFEDPLTRPGPPTRLVLAVAPAFTAARMLGYDVTGFTVAADVGYRVRRGLAIGGSFRIGSLGGTYTIGPPPPDPHPIAVVPVAVAAFVQAFGLEKVWGAALVGLSFDHVADDLNPATWTTELGIGLHGGIDLFSIGRHRLGIYARAEGEPLSDAGNASLSFGVLYRN